MVLAQVLGLSLCWQHMWHFSVLLCPGQSHCTMLCSAQRDSPHSPLEQTRVPLLHIVMSGLEGGSGQTAEEPAQTLLLRHSEFPSHISPAFLKTHWELQHRPWLGLHCLPSFSLHSMPEGSFELWQHGSLSLWPTSHSSPSSTMRFPQMGWSLSTKHVSFFTLRR